MKWLNWQNRIVKKIDLVILLFDSYITGLTFLLWFVRFVCTIRIKTRHCCSLHSLLHTAYVCSYLFMKYKKKEESRSAWWKKVQCNCRIIYKFFQQNYGEKKPKDANTTNAYRLIWDGQCIQLNGMMKEMFTSLYAADRLFLLRVPFFLSLYVCVSVIVWRGLWSKKSSVKWIKKPLIVCCNHCAERANPIVLHFQFEIPNFCTFKMH